MTAHIHSDASILGPAAHTLDEPIRPHTRAELDHVRGIVAAHSTGPDDERHLLAALGLMEEQ